MDSSEIFLGIDVGGTKGRVTAFRNLTERVEVNNLEFGMTKAPDGDFMLDFDRLVQVCEAMVRRYGSIGGIGLAVAGKVDADRTMLTGAGNLGHWVHQPVAEMLSQRFQCPVILGNDAEAAALAEAHYGHGKGRDFWFVIWGTGVGGCLVRHVNGVPTPFAGEMGHQRVSPNDLYQCGCGQYSCVEAYCGGTGILNRFKKPAEELSSHLWGNVAYWMAIGVHNAVTIQPTDLVVFGGGIANKQSHLLDNIGGELNEKLLIVDQPKLILSAFGESAGTIGALSMLHLL